MKLYSYFFCGEKLEEKAFEAKECSKTYTALERGVGCIYKGMRINKESIGNLIEHSIIQSYSWKKAGMRRLKRSFQEKRDVLILQKEISTVHRKTLRILKN